MIVKIQHNSIIVYDLVTNKFYVFFYLKRGVDIQKIKELIERTGTRIKGRIIMKVCNDLKEVKSFISNTRLLLRDYIVKRAHNDFKINLLKKTMGEWVVK